MPIDNLIPLSPMQTLRRVPVGLLVFILFGTAIATPTADEHIVAFVVPPARILRDLNASLPELEKQRPDLAEDLKKVPAHFDPSELVHRLSVLLRKGLTDEDRTATLAFIATPAGIEAGRLQRESANVPDQQSVAAQISAENLRQINAFFESNGGRKLLRLLNSPEASTIVQAYSRSLICAQLKVSHPKQEAQFEAQGFCSN